MAGQSLLPLGVRFDDSDYVGRLNRKLAKLKDVHESDVKAAGIEAVNQAKNFAAVDTGFMRNNLYWKEGRDERGYVLTIYCRASYWRFVEFGTRFMAAQPFVRPALVLAKQFLIARVKRRSR